MCRFFEFMKSSKLKLESWNGLMDLIGRANWIMGADHAARLKSKEYAAHHVYYDEWSFSPEHFLRIVRTLRHTPADNLQQGT